MECHVPVVGVSCTRGCRIRRQHPLECKGWYDEQLLASPTSTSGALESPNVRGIVIPEPGLDTRGMSGYRAAAWLPVATVVLNRNSPPYHSKYGFDQDVVPLGSGLHSKVSMCLAPSSNPTHCGPKPVDTCMKDTKNDGFWYSKFTARDKSERLLCVAYRPNEFNIQPPSVVRWRWTLRDETIWVSCPAGCCEGNSIGM